MDIGVDTHKETHILVVLDAQGHTAGRRTVTNSPEGGAAALPWVPAHDARRRWGIAHSGSLGKGFAQFLLAHGESDVREISAQRTAQYRRRGHTQNKTDHADALAVARLLLADGAPLPAVQRDDRSRESRLLSDQRDNLVAERRRLINQLHARMVQIDPGYGVTSGAWLR